jgi:creatinine amidohydrolase/Fe(II)-dependent formamide hydrolase-like protein
MSDRPFFWGDLTSAEFRALDPECTIVVLPVAAVEQHGPHLPVLTDTAIADGMLVTLRRMLPRELRVLVLPTQAYGKSNEHLLSPGTVTLTAQTLIDVLIEIGANIARVGLRKVVLMNSHGGTAKCSASSRENCASATTCSVSLRIGGASGYRRGCTARPTRNPASTRATSRPR